MAGEEILLVLAISAALMPGSATFAQQPSATGMLLDVSKPSVYIRPVKSLKNLRRKDRGGVEIRIRLFNNTRRAIRIPTESLDRLPSRSQPHTRSLILSDGSDVLTTRPGGRVYPCYIVEEPDGRSYMSVGDPSTEPKPDPRPFVPFDFPPYKRRQRPFGPSCTERSTSWVASGESVFFTVPLEHLNPNYYISFPFNYEWEKKRGMSGITLISQPRMLFGN